MVWNKNTPAFNEPVSQGDNRIRELKQDLQTIFQKDFKNSDWNGQPGTSKHNHFINPQNILQKDGVYKVLADDNSSTNYRILKIQVYHNGAWRNATNPTFQHKTTKVNKHLFEPGDIIVVYGNTAPVGWVQQTIAQVFNVNLSEIMLGISLAPGSSVIGSHSLSSVITHSHALSTEFLASNHSHQGTGQVATSGTNDGKEAYKISGGDEIVKLHHYHIISYSVNSVRGGSHTHMVSEYTTGNYKRANFILVKRG